MNPQDDPERGEFSNVGRDGWRLSDALCLCVVLAMEWAGIVLVIKAIWGG